MTKKLADPKSDSQIHDPLEPYLPLQRFGHPLDIWAFRVLRVIAIFDSIWVTFLASFASIHGPTKTFTENIGVILLDAVLNLVYAAGVILQLRTSVVMLETGSEYVDPKTIVQYRVKRPTFWADVFSCLGAFWSILNIHYAALFRLLRCWRMPSSNSFLYELTDGEMDNSMWAIFELVLSILLIMHVFACAWFCAILTGTSDYDLLEQKLGSDWYLSCLHAGADLLSGLGEPKSVQALGGYSDNEASACVVLGPIGAVYLAYIFAKAVDLLEAVNHSTFRYRNRVTEVSSMLHSLTVPASLKARILTYHTFLSIHNVPHNGQEHGAYGELCHGMTKSLHQELKVHLFEQLVLTAPFFQEMPSQVVVQMVTAFSEAVYGPGDMIIVQGESGTELFFIVKGWCEVLIQNENSEWRGQTVVATKQAGDYFGEVALVLDQLRTASIRAKSFCILAKLTRTAFEAVLDNCPLVKETMIMNIIRQTGAKHFQAASSKGSKEKTDGSSSSSDTSDSNDDEDEAEDEAVESLQSARNVLRSARRLHSSDCPELATEPALDPFEKDDDTIGSCIAKQKLLAETNGAKAYEMETAMGFQWDLQTFEQDAWKMFESAMNQIRPVIEAIKSSDDDVGDNGPELEALTKQMRSMRFRFESIDDRLRHVEVARATKRHRELLQSMLRATQPDDEPLLKI